MPTTDLLPEPVAISTFCDDIRYEVNGKFSLIGIYRNDMILQAPFPALLPKLAVAITMIEHPDAPTGKLQVSIHFPGDPKEKPQFAAEVDYKDDGRPDETTEGTKRVIIMHFMLNPITFTQPGRIQVRIRRDKQLIKAGSINVKSSQPQFPDPDVKILGAT